MTLIVKDVELLKVILFGVKTSPSLAIISTIGMLVKLDPVIVISVAVLGSMVSGEIEV